MVQTAKVKIAHWILLLAVGVGQVLTLTVQTCNHKTKQKKDKLQLTTCFGNNNYTSLKTHVIPRAKLIFDSNG